MLDPDSLCHIFVSPRQRAQKTFELLFNILPQLPPHTTTEEVREWDYGDYEGLTSAEIDMKNPGWSIWSDGSVNPALCDRYLLLMCCDATLKTSLC